MLDPSFSLRVAMEPDIYEIEGLSDEEAARGSRPRATTSCPRPKRQHPGDRLRRHPRADVPAAGGRRHASTSASATVREALMLLGFVFVVMGITLYQERKTERALEALRDLSSPRALVIRDGEQQAHRRAARWCRGDIVVLAEGDRVPGRRACCSPASTCRSTSRC